MHPQSHEREKRLQIPELSSTKTHARRRHVPGLDQSIRSGAKGVLLEALLVDDGLGVLDGLLGVGVLEAAAGLPVLELRADARADAHRVALRVLRTSCAATLLAVRVRHAAARRELRAYL